LDPLAYLFSLDQFGIKFGLENIATLVARLGHPQRAFRTIHVAGTNGKGSVTAMVDAALRAAGHRTARFTSPHLVDLNERFVIDGRPVSSGAMIEALADVRTAIDSLRGEGALGVQPTFFEVTTAVAFELFRRAGVEVAVIEVGLGGRLDATNVIVPMATAITSIAFDHQRYLGSTLRDIAVEKAGIIKPGVPVIVGEVDPEPLAAIEEIARQRGSAIVRAFAADVDHLEVGLAGAHQHRNAAVALRLLETISKQGVLVAPDAIATGIATAQWPGRLESRRLPDGREILLDAAHNPAGAAALASYLKGLPGPARPLVFAAMRDKDIRGMLTELAPAAAQLIVTRASNARSEEPSVILAQARAVAPSLPASAEPSVTGALAAAWRTSPRITVAGSIFLLGDVLRELR
jgi:dihydrofolate synthase/folylpolyglutamate synthase